MAELKALLQYLDSDPTNLSLLADAASSALDQGEADTAVDLLGRYRALAPLPPALVNLLGLVQLHRGLAAEAAEAFGSLLAGRETDPALASNLACARFMMGDHQGALALLEDRVAEAMPQAATLKVKSLHRLGKLEEALAAGAGLARLQPDNGELMGALATAALDAEDVESARSYAERAGDRPEGLSTLGMLKLQGAGVEESLALFDRALAARPDDARAHLGKGLALLSHDETAVALPHLDQAAELFGTHLGSWIAAGWAYFTQGDYKTSRARFESALERDDTFAEIHGGLAVLDIVEGRLGSARRRTELALRLDPKSLSGALAKSLLLAADGDQAAAEEIQARALSTPVGGSGETLQQLISAMAQTGKRVLH